MFICCYEGAIDVYTWLWVVIGGICVVEYVHKRGCIITRSWWGRYGVFSPCFGRFNFVFYGCGFCGVGFHMSVVKFQVVGCDPHKINTNTILVFSTNMNGEPIFSY